MKRNVALTILGLAVAGVTTSYGQGQIQFSNYYGTPIVIDGVGNVTAGDTVQVELWWAVGSGLNDNDLSFGSNVDISAFPGYASQAQLFLVDSGWAAGNTVTFQYRASGTVSGQAVDTALSRGPLVEIDQLTDSQVVPTPLPYKTTSQAGFSVVVPEPSTFALAGLGAAALLIFRRRD